jgi:hypothetical protein
MPEKKQALEQSWGEARILALLTCPPRTAELSQNPSTQWLSPQSQHWPSSWKHLGPRPRPWWALCVTW